MPEVIPRPSEIHHPEDKPPEDARANELPFQHPDPAATFGTFHGSALMTGRIRTEPAEFQVVEHLPFEPAGTGEHIYLWIEKTGANSGWVAHQLAGFLGINDGDVGFAGRKDRHAIVRQWFSCYEPHGRDVTWADFSADGVSLLEVTRHRSKLRRGDLEKNQFEILVRHEDMNDALSAQLETRLVQIRDRGFPNYFGSQRFGREGANLTAADRLLRAGEKSRGNRGMLISAARAWLFNRYLAERLDREPLTGELGPLIGKSRDPQPGEATHQPFEREWVAGLRKLGARVAERPLWVIPGDMAWAASDQGTLLTFSLPAGSFATSLLREAFNVVDVMR